MPKIQFYQNDNEKEPVREWLKNQNESVKKSVGSKINMVQVLLLNIRSNYETKNK